MSLLVTGFLLLANILSLCWLFKRRKRLLGEPPLVRHRIPFFGKALEFGRNPERFLKRFQKKHGNIFTFKMAGWHVHAVVHPLDVASIEKQKQLKFDAIGAVIVGNLVGDKHSFHNPKSRVYDVTHPIAIRNQEIPKSLYQNLIGPLQVQSFYHFNVRNVIKAIKFIMEGKLIKIRQDNKIDLVTMTDKLIFFLSHENLFGSLPNEEENLEEVNKFYLPLKEFAKYAPMIVNGVHIELLRKAVKARADILKVLKNLRLSQRQNVCHLVRKLFEVDSTEENFVNHMLVVLWAGQFNTGSALFWNMFYILKHTDVREKVEKEIQTVLTSLKDKTDPGTIKPKITLDDILKIEKQDLNKFVILESVLMEVLRLTTSGMNMRKATEDLTMQTHDNTQYKIRKGDMVFYYSQMLHFDRDIYPEPQKFQYDRFLEKTTSDQGDSEALKLRTKFLKNGKKIAPPRSQLSFGFGEGRCPGQKLALFEIKFTTIALLTCFNMNLETDQIPEMNLEHLGMGVLPPTNEVFINMSRK